MAFDVSKFLALTVLIAGTGAACSSDDKEDPNGGGSAGKTTAGAPDKGGDAGADNGGAGNGKAGEGSLGGEGGGTSTDGGMTSVGGIDGGGAGGDGPTEPCLSNALLMGEGGAGGAGALDVDPSLEGLCSDLYDIGCPSLEGEQSPAYTICEGIKDKGLTITALTVGECLTALSPADRCDPAKSAACFDNLVGKACVVPDSTEPCEAIHTTCTDEPVSVSECRKVADLLNPESYINLTGCMDPADEDADIWSSVVETKCSERLVACARWMFPG